MYALLGLLLALTARALHSGKTASDAVSRGSSGGSGEASITEPTVIYSPARPPAIPLAVRSPYTSVWSSTKENGTLNTNGVQFWTGQAIGWEGIVIVDDIAYEWMGTIIANTDLPQLDNFKSAIPLSVSYDSQYSNFTFAAGPIHLTASFLSPVIPQDLCRTSVPLSYLEVSYESQDGHAHHVKLYTDVDNSWVNYDAAAPTTSGLNVDSPDYVPNSTVADSTLFTWWYRLDQEYYFSQLNDFAQWGNMTLSTRPGQSKNFTYASGQATNVRYEYVTKGYLSNYVDSKVGQVFAFSHDMGECTTGRVLYTVGVIQEPVINLLTSEGLQALNPWWSSGECYGPSLYNLIATHYDDFATVRRMAATWEKQLKADIADYYRPEKAPPSSTEQPPPKDTSVYSNNIFLGTYESGSDQFGQQWIFNPNNGYGYLDAVNKSGIAIPDVPEDHSYYSIVALSTRQIMAAYTLTIPPDFNCGNSSTVFNASEPFMFQKEISSNGNMNTVDVLYPAMPFFLYANPNLLRYAMNPLYLNQESGFYPWAYSMHDLGFNFPNATGHVDGMDEQMPVEESGNMLLMTYAYYKFTGDAKYLRDHYTKLYQWSQFLIEYTLIPSTQLSTDDFVGALENQTNLAIKGIVGLQAMSKIAEVAGVQADSANFTSISTSYYDAWEQLAIDPTGTHTVLAYQWRSSWGLLYNSFPDKLLNLGVIRQEVYDMQSRFYATVSQVFGVPLDSRVSLAKSDWEMWAAATCAPHTRRLIVNAIAYWINNTVTDHALTDLYETISDGGYPTGVEFIARPVVGGHFSLLALKKANGNSTSGTGDDMSSSSSSSSSPPHDDAQSLPQTVSTTTMPIPSLPHPESAPSAIVGMGVNSASRSVAASTSLFIIASM